MYGPSFTVNAKNLKSDKLISCLEVDCVSLLPSDYIGLTNSHVGTAIEAKGGMRVLDLSL